LTNDVFFINYLLKQVCLKTSQCHAFCCYYFSIFARFDFVTKSIYSVLFSERLCKSIDSHFLTILNLNR